MESIDWSVEALSQLITDLIKKKKESPELGDSIDRQIEKVALWIVELQFLNQSPIGK